MYRRAKDGVQVLLVHPGGPFWRNKDAGAWSIPKGHNEPGEQLLDTARREFREETGIQPAGQFVPLPPVKMKSGKIVHAWCFEGDCDASKCRSNMFAMEWPPRSGKRVEYPETDEARFFDLEAAAVKILPAQAPLLKSLEQVLQTAQLNSDDAKEAQKRLADPADETITLEELRQDLGL